MSHDTAANGNRITLLACQQGTARESRARRVAAALDRNDPAVDRVAPGAGDRVNVWLAGTDGHDRDRTIRFHPPDGWHIAYSDVTSSGATCLTLRPDE